LAVHFTRLNVVREVILETMAAETLGSGADRLAVLASLHVPPVHVESIFAGFPYFCLVGIEFCFTHHLATIGVSHNLFVFEVGLYVFCGLAVHL
jgi:hypothetical protein